MYKGTIPVLYIKSVNKKQVLFIVLISVLAPTQERAHRKVEAALIFSSPLLILIRD